MDISKTAAAAANELGHSKLAKHFTIFADVVPLILVGAGLASAVASTTPAGLQPGASAPSAMPSSDA